jgi:hypothetical protein
MDIYAVDSISNEIEKAKTKVYDIINDRIINDISSKIYEYLDKAKITDLDYDFDKEKITNFNYYFDIDDDIYITISFMYDGEEHIIELCRGNIKYYIECYEYSYYNHINIERFDVNILNKVNNCGGKTFYIKCLCNEENKYENQLYLYKTIDNEHINFIPIAESIIFSLKGVFETYLRISHNMFNYPVLKYEKITLLILCVNKYTDNILSWIPRDVFLIIAKDVFKGRFSSKYNR